MIPASFPGGKFHGHGIQVVTVFLPLAIRADPGDLAELLVEILWVHDSHQAADFVDGQGGGG